MKDTIKNSIIGLFAIFGFVALISSSNNAPTVIHEGSNTPESHVWGAIATEGTGTTLLTSSYIVLYNKVTGESKACTRNHGGKGMKIKFEDANWAKQKK